MLLAYQRLEAHGAIGKMMKVDASGEVVYDPGGEKPGNLVPRPFQEYPKTIRRYTSDGACVENIVHSKSEELRLIAESPDVQLGIPLSPLERERNDLAQQVASYEKANGHLQAQIGALTEQMAALARKIDQRDTERVALGQGTSDAVKKGLEGVKS